MLSCVAHGHHIKYRRSILPFQKFKLQTKIIGTRDRSLFFEQRFIVNGNIVCHAINKTTMADKNAKMYQVLGMVN